MKRINILRKCTAILAVVVSAAFIFEACAKEPSPLEGGGRITMTTKASKVFLVVAGSEDISVDWGNGKKSNVKDAFFNKDFGWLVFTHDYSNMDAHNIVITGNVTLLYCRRIELTDLDVSRNTTLTDLDCSSNQLTALDVSKNTALNNLDCNYNQITKLDMSKNTALWALSCVGNQLTAIALNDLFRTLPDRKTETEEYGGFIFIMERDSRAKGNPGVFDCDLSIAEKKGWVFMKD